MKTKEYWDKTFETRYETLLKDETRPPLKVSYYFLSKNKNTM